MEQITNIIDSNIKLQKELRKRAGIYGRVSSDKQAKKGLSIERQLEIGNKVCQDNDFEVY